MKKEPKIFVIIVTYKGMRWYDKCFGSLRESTVPVQTVVVDNTPGDEDAVYIKTLYPEIHLIKTNENLGFGRANNLGMRYALDNGCDYVFLLNQDTWLDDKDAITKLSMIAEKHPEYAILSPMHLAANEKHLRFTIDDGNRNYELLSDFYFNTLKDIYPIKYVNAAAWFMPRKTLETIGGFCPLIFHYGEDDDYINRLHYHGYKIGLVPSSSIVHDAGKKKGESLQFFNRAQSDGMYEFLNINNSVSLYTLRHYLWRKSVLGWLGRKQERVVYWHKYKVLHDNWNAIIESRKNHKIKQPNWL